MPETDINWSAVITGFLGDLPPIAEDPKKSFFKLWRNFSLQTISDLSLCDTDKPIWNQADIKAAQEVAGADWGLLSTAIGPVQSFIAEARTVRDLWSGSAILSHLSFAGMAAVFDRLGPTAIIFPSLRGSPLMDNWLKEKGIAPNTNDAVVQKAPSLPHRFLAIIPWSQQEEIRRQVKEAISNSWKELAAGVESQISGKLQKTLGDNWDEYWDEQIKLYPEIHVSVISNQEMNEQKLRELLGRKDLPSRWPALTEVAGRMLEAQRLVREFPALSTKEFSPPKCSMTGSLEAMGPLTLSENAKNWEKAIKDGCKLNKIRLRKSERLSAPALVKRYAPAVFGGEWGLSSEDLRYPDTASVAGAIWLQENNIEPAKHDNWNGQWIYPHIKDHEEPIPENLKPLLKEAKSLPPLYYAVLIMDGDHMGKWLRGEYILDNKPLTPEYSAALSLALGNFAAQVAPRVVEEYCGTLIYSGGDDVLALLPVATALSCAQALRGAFSCIISRKAATASTGIAIVHFTEDLRIAIDGARKAEKEAKKTRNSLGINLMPRSGEERMLACDWQGASRMEKLFAHFVAGTSDRWAYLLRQRLQGINLADAYPSLLQDAYPSLLQYALKRGDTGKEFQKEVREFWDEWPGKPDLTGFISLCLGASFMARVSKGGRE